MSMLDEAYVQLRAISVAEWPLWLESHDITASRFHWWLALLERLEVDLRSADSKAESEFVEVAEFIVAILDYAVHSGAWRLPYAGGMLCRYSLLVADGPFANSSRIPIDLTVDGAARRTLDSFELSPSEAAEVAYLAEAEGLVVPTGREEDWNALQDIQWALPQLIKLVGKIDDEDLINRIEDWVAIETLLSRVV